MLGGTPFDLAEVIMDSTLPQIRNILFTTDLSKQTVHAFNYAVGL